MFLTVCKKMLLNSEFADNIFSVVGEDISSLRPHPGWSRHFPLCAVIGGSARQAKSKTGEAERILKRHLPQVRD